MSPSTVKVAIAEEFLDALVRLPDAARKKAATLLRKFRSDPASPGLNYEKIESEDPRVRSLRVDQNYRAIVLAPDSGSTYTIVYVGAHDEAYRWARRRTWAVNPATGGIDVVEIPDAAPVPASTPTDRRPEKRPAKPPLFVGAADGDLARLGVGRVLLPHVRAFADRDDFEAAETWMPKDVYENLFFLLDGYSVEQILELPERSEFRATAAEPVSFEAALLAPASSAAFHLVEDDRDLEEILSAPLEKWRVFLHPSQKRTVVRDVAGPSRVIGGPGTGKTVVALHRARELARRFLPDPKQRVLLTTFTRNLADDLGASLVALCGEERRRIDVQNIDTVIGGVLRNAGRTLKFANEDEQKAAWTAAMAVAPVPGIDMGFLRDEYENVVQAQGCVDESSYLSAPRAGRRRALTRADRRALWATFAAFRTELARDGKTTFEDAAEAARQLVLAGKAVRPWSAAVVDEAQDFSPSKLRFVRALIPEGRNDLFLAGDAHQRIYGRTLPLSRVGIDIRGRGARLTLNYRTTKEIAAFALAVLKGTPPADDLDESQADFRGYRSIRRGPAAEVRRFATEEDETAAVGQHVRSLAAAGVALNEICLVARTLDDLEPCRASLRAAGIPTCEVTAERTPEGVAAVRCATMHRVKGLEFRAIVVPGLRDTRFPLAKSRRFEEPEADWLARERQLLFVACTRARDRLLLTASGTPSALLG